MKNDLTKVSTHTPLSVYSYLLLHGDTRNDIFWRTGIFGLFIIIDIIMFTTIPWDTISYHANDA